MATWPHIFGGLAGNVPGSYLDDNFASAAFAVDLTALSNTVVALPSSATPLIPVAGGVAGVSATLSRSDHQHPVQPATVNLQAGTSYTLQASDDGKVVELSNAAAITVTVPNSLPAGFSCLMTMVSTGQPTIVAGSGASLHQASGFTKARAQWSVVTLYIRANAGSAAEGVLSGDMA